MGLNAIVYKNIANLSTALRDRVRVIDANTGELELILQGEPDPHYNDDLLGADIHIGNVALVEKLRNEILTRWNGQCRILLSKVLFNGTHSGDFIHPDDAQEIRREIEGLTASESVSSPDLTKFFADMRRLLGVAQTENNPIVFV